jgi:hypothetical protein
MIHLTFGNRETDIALKTRYHFEKPILSDKIEIFTGPDIMHEIRYYPGNPISSTESDIIPGIRYDLAYYQRSYQGSYLTEDSRAQPNTFIYRHIYLEGDSS